MEGCDSECGGMCEFGYSECGGICESLSIYSVFVGIIDVFVKSDRRVLKTVGNNLEDSFCAATQCDAC